VTGTLFLKSNIHLDFENRAKLYGSTSLDDYAEVPVATEEPQFSKCRRDSTTERHLPILLRYLVVNTAE
jgi:polygalacturonase